MKTNIDLNCDLGEGLNNEHLIMPLISSCNISCGAHAGSVETIDKVLALALKHDVKIGAHPSFPDRENFGRVVLKMSDTELLQSLVEQLRLFKQRVALQNGKVHHVKPHGALYNIIAVSSSKALVVVRAIQEVFDDVKLYLPFNSRIESVALANGLDIVYEAFADRNYTDDLKLVSRGLPYAIIEDPEEIVHRVRRMAEAEQVHTVKDTIRDIKAETFCVHGDHPKVVEILEVLNGEFEVR